MDENKKTTTNVLSVFLKQKNIENYNIWQNVLKLIKTIGKIQ